MDRRRLLDNKQSIPFWEDCVFYAPLTQGETRDIVSGIDVTIDTNCSMSYNSTEEAYRFTSAQNYPSPLNSFSWKYLSLGLVNASTTQNTIEYTLTAKIKIVTARDITMSRHIPSLSYMESTNDYVFAWASRGAFFNDSIDGNWHTYIVRVKNGIVQSIKDLVIKTSNSMNITLAGIMTKLDCNKYVSIYVMPRNSPQFSGSSYIKDIRIYNRALTDAEIAQL